MKGKGFFDEEFRLEKLSRLGDSLEKLNERIDWELFRPIVEGVFPKKVVEKGGRPPFDYVLMFKILILQRLHNIADDKTEFLINDRLSFQRFLGLRQSDTVPDAKTIWNFREQLVKAQVAEKLFDLFGEQLETEGMITHTGSIIDATFVDVPKQRNTREENKTIKEGNIPENWKEDAEIKEGEMPLTDQEKARRRHKLAQKDTDARWTKKNNETHYGYKNHPKVDAQSKLITKSVGSNAAVHDSQKIVELVDEKDEVVYADSAYVGEELHAQIKEKNPKVELKIHEKGCRNKPLTEEQKKSNNEKSKTRVRVEHVFGFMTNSMNGISLRCIGKLRAECAMTLMNLAYNLSRYVYLRKIGFGNAI
ncbi:DDE transposase [Spirochaetia bacterium]|nr:DDE transposase [Spirochaetia bacterium]